MTDSANLDDRRGRQEIDQIPFEVIVHVSLTAASTGAPSLKSRRACVALRSGTQIQIDLDELALDLVQ